MGINESNFFKRRFNQEEIEDEFIRSLNYSTNLFNYILDINDVSEDDFKRIVMNVVMGGNIHQKLSNGGQYNFPYDETYSFLLNHYESEIENRYKKIVKDKTNNGVINENKVVDIIQEMGLYDAIRYFGGYNNVTKKMGDYVLSNDDMIWFIMDVVKHLSNNYGQYGVSVWDLDMNPIMMGHPDEDLQQIEYFNPTGLSIHIYEGKDYERHRGSFNEQYEDLDDNTLDEVFLFMVDALENNK